VDEDLIRATRENQPHAGAFMVSMYGPKLMGYCLTIAPDLSEVDREFICEQAVEKACRKIGEFDPAKGSLVAWLRGFVRYGVLNWRRAAGVRAREPVDELGLPAWQPPAQPELPPDDPRIARLAPAVQALPLDHQLLLALRYIEGLPTREIAARLGLSDDMVRQRLSRLTRQLRRQVASENDAGLGGAALAADLTHDLMDKDVVMNDPNAHRMDARPGSVEELIARTRATVPHAAAPPAKAADHDQDTWFEAAFAALPPGVFDPIVLATVDHLMHDSESISATARQRLVRGAERGVRWRQTHSDQPGHLLCDPGTTSG
jgi:RNA polymerase sigma-70 factor, ECF subfamily